MSHIKFGDLLKEMLLKEVSIDQLHTQFVESEKLSQETFDEIVDAAGGKSSYATWLAAKVEHHVIKEEDVYKFKDYFQTFEKYKRAYPKQDLNQYKTPRDIEEFKAKSIEILDQKNIPGEEVADTKNLLSPTQIKSLSDVGIKYLGNTEGYQVFEIPTSCKGDEQAYKVYKNLLGQCSGGKIEICTIANFSYFNNYLKDGPYYVFFNLSDPNSPYQFHYESNQFMDRQDRSVF